MDASEFISRLSRVETLVETQAATIDKIDGNVLLLLESKWKREGRNAGLSVLISGVVALIVAYFNHK